MRDYDAEITLRRELERLVEAVAAEVDASSEKCLALRWTAALVESSSPTSSLDAVRWFRRSLSAASGPEATSTPDQVPIAP